MYTIKGTGADKSIKFCLKPTEASNLQYGHYYLFHTQFDVFNCYIGRTTVNPFAVAVYKNRYGMNLNGTDNHLYFARTCNKLPNAAYDILKQSTHKYLYDITDAVAKEGLHNVVAFLDRVKDELLKSKQEYNQGYDDEEIEKE